MTLNKAFKTIKVTFPGNVRHEKHLAVIIYNLQLTSSIYFTTFKENHVSVQYLKKALSFVDCISLLNS